MVNSYGKYYNFHSSRKIIKNNMVNTTGAILEIQLILLGRYNFRSNEFVTTDTELNAIAKPANSGFNIRPNEVSKPAAIGIHKTL